MKLNALFFLATLSSVAEAGKQSTDNCECESFEYVLNDEEQTFNMHQRILVDPDKEWLKRGCTFASITTKEEMDLAMTNADYPSFFVGMTRPSVVDDPTSRGEEGGWYWLDGTDQNAFTIDLWASDEPTNDSGYMRMLEGNNLLMFATAVRMENGKLRDVEPFNREFQFPALFECCIPKATKTLKHSDSCASSI
jgi:hypothetical protein